MKYEYKVIKLERTAQQTERELNTLGLQGWKVVCSYAYDNSHIILMRELN